MTKKIVLNIKLLIKHFIFYNKFTKNLILTVPVLVKKNWIDVNPDLNIPITLELTFSSVSW